jgi:hypothetical protein
MKRSDIQPIPDYFDRYINLIDDIELDEAFAQSLARIDSIDVERLMQLGDYRYAPDKWTVREAIQHFTDWERIFCYRALLLARNEGNPLPGIEESTLAKGMNANSMPIPALIADLRAVRVATRSLFSTFIEEMLRTTGKIWVHEMPVLAIGFLILGHEAHHMNIIEEKYLSSLGAAA